MSGEFLQDHWSSGSFFYLRIHYIYDFWTIAAVIRCWHYRDNPPERKIEQKMVGDIEKKSLMPADP